MKTRLIKIEIIIVVIFALVNLILLNNYLKKILVPDVSEFIAIDTNNTKCVNNFIIVYVKNIGNEPVTTDKIILLGSKPDGTDLFNLGSCSVIHEDIVTLEAGTSSIACQRILIGLPGLNTIFANYKQPVKIQC